MKFIIAFFYIFASVGCKTIQTKKDLPLYPSSILQGLTTDLTTQISVLRHQSTEPSYKIKPNLPVKVISKKSKYSPWVVDHLYLTELKNNTNYQLQVIDNKLGIIDERTFKNLNLNKKTLKVSIASCMDSRKSNHQKQIWREFNSLGSDLHFFIGDNVYADAGAAQKGMATAQELWQKYVKTRSLLEIYKIKKLTPTLATWDDHDYGNNGGGINYPFKKESLNTFYSFFSQDSVEHTSFKKGPGISFSFSIADQLFYFMDNRYFRTNKKTKPDYHWGPDQQEWLFTNLNKNNRFSWLINGNQFFGGYQNFESFEKNHPTNFVNLLGELNKIKTKVAFISGDRHLSELMKIGAPDLPYNTIELTSSAIHAKVYPSSWDKKPNPRQIHGKANALNYAYLESKQTKNGLSIHIKAFGLNKKVFYQHSQIIK